MKINSIMLIAPAAIFSASCNMQSNLSSDRPIHIPADLGKQPYKRNSIIKAFGLANVASEIMNGGIRSGNMLFIEKWQTCDSFEIYGVNYKFVGPIEINQKLLDSISDVKSDKYQRVYVMDKSGKMVFDTNNGDDSSR